MVQGLIVLVRHMVSASGASTPSVVTTLKFAGSTVAGSKESGARG